MSRSERLVGWIERTVCLGGENEEQRQRKVQFTVFTIFVIPAASLWALLYFLYDEPIAAAIPGSYSVLTLVNLLLLARFRKYEVYRRTQQVMIVLLPFFLHISLGGFVGSSAVIVWSFLAVIAGVLFGEGREAYLWFGIFILDIILVALLQPNITIENHLPHGLIVTLFVLNLTTVSTIAYGVLYSFLKDRRKLRELELAYLNQEMMLRQQEKLATLGTLAAGVAHELNNPAAATHRAALQLRDAFKKQEESAKLLDEYALTPQEREVVSDFSHRAHAHVPSDLDALTRSDREAEVEQWLDDHAVSGSWEIAPVLVTLGVTPQDLTKMAAEVRPNILGPIITAAAATLPVHSLVGEINEGTRRISDIVVAMKSYSYLDQAPIQNINVHEGLDSTLVIMQNRLGTGIDVKREYADDLPAITAYGSELNQVWTNLLGNAIDAVSSNGTITIRTKRDSTYVIVEIEDNGAGIPEAIQSRIFDPFFTTKEPGKGTGLGLSTSYSIVTGKHKGSISVKSRPGSTCFTVRLPIDQTQSVREQKV